MTNPQTLHGTALVLDGQGLLIRGASGSGKSRLALALLTEAGCWPLTLSDGTQRPDPSGDQSDDGATALVGDDRLVLSVRDDRLVAAPPEPLAGLLEVRGLGLVTMPWRRAVALDLLVELMPADALVRMPETHQTMVQGIRVPTIQVPTADLAHQMLLVRTGLRLLTR